MSEAQNESPPAEAAPEKPKTSRLARASLWFGMIGLVVAIFLGPIVTVILIESSNRPLRGIVGAIVTQLLVVLPAVACGWVALSRIGRSGGTLRGRGRAIAGIVLACLSAGAAVFVTGSVADARHEADIAACKTTMANIRTAILQHAHSHNGWLPKRLSDLVSEDRLPAYMFVCPATGRWDEVAKGVDARGDYIYAGAGHHIHEAEPSTIPILWDRPENHGGEGVNVAYLDGHVQWQEEVPTPVPPPEPAPPFEPAAGAAGHSAAK